MRIPVLTAVSGSRWEAGLVQALERTDLGVTVVRRCVDLADLLATAATGTARAVLVSSDLRRLDRDALSRLAVAGVAVVGLVSVDDEDAERRLRQLGIVHVLPADSAPETISAAVIEAVAAASAPLPAGAPLDTRTALPDLSDPPVDDLAWLDRPVGNGRVIAVWGPTGAPGRTTVAVGLATEAAALGESTTLVDADVYGGAVAQTLGLLDEAPGLAAAARLANSGALDVLGLAKLTRRLTPTLRVLTGITRAERWTELRPAAMEVVMTMLRQLTPVTVVDCSFCLEQDEELAYDQSAARRNGATLAVLAAADTVVAVGSADPVSLQRLVRGLSELSAVLPGVAPCVVINRVRSGLVPGDLQAEIVKALERYAGVTPTAFIPDDRAGLDQAMSVGRSLAEIAPGSPARKAIRELARTLLGHEPAAARRSLLRRHG